MPTVTDGHLEASLGDLSNLLQDIGQRLAVMDIFRKRQRTDYGAYDFGRHDAPERAQEEGRSNSLLLSS